MVNNLDGIFKMAFATTCLWCHHKNIRRYTNLCQMFLREGEDAGEADCYQSSKVGLDPGLTIYLSIVQNWVCAFQLPLRHHLIILLLALVYISLDFLGNVFALDPHWACPKFIALTFLMKISLFYRQA